MTMQKATMDDGAPSPSISVLERLRLSRELATIKTDLSGLADGGPGAALTRLKLVARANQIRARLGAGLTPVPGGAEPAGEPGELGDLREVVAGRHDGLGLDALLTKIETAAKALHDAGKLAGDAETLAHDAISHWARLELQANG